MCGHDDNLLQDGEVGKKDYTQITPATKLILAAHDMMTSLVYITFTMSIYVVFMANLWPCGLVSRLINDCTHKNKR